jgi:NAD(P)-dependent dehydrogenase (short-subunit alcohol dehydrogenase family)
VPCCTCWTAKKAFLTQNAIAGHGWVRVQLENTECSLIAPTHCNQQGYEPAATGERQPSSLIAPRRLGGFPRNPINPRLHREGSPKNIAQAVLFFLDNDFVTGVCLPVDGGRTAYAPE